jgi:hypothetical protein
LKLQIIVGSSGLIRAYGVHKGAASAISLLLYTENLCSDVKSSSPLTQTIAFSSSIFSSRLMLALLNLITAARPMPTRLSFLPEFHALLSVTWAFGMLRISFPFFSNMRL